MTRAHRNNTARGSGPCSTNDCSNWRLVLTKLIAGKVALMWVGLLANIGFMLSLVMLLQRTDSPQPTHTLSPMRRHFARRRACPVPLSDRHSGRGSCCPDGRRRHDLRGCLALVCIAGPLHWPPRTPPVSAPKPPNESSSLCAPSCTAKWWHSARPTGPRIKTSDVVQSAGEGVEQIQSFFELFLPQLFYAILAPITLFAAIAPINVPAAADHARLRAAHHHRHRHRLHDRRPRLQEVLGAATPTWAPHSSTTCKASRP